MQSVPRGGRLGRAGALGAPRQAHATGDRLPTAAGSEARSSGSSPRSFLVWVRLRPGVALECTRASRSAGRARTGRFLRGRVARSRARSPRSTRRRERDPWRGARRPRERVHRAGHPRDVVAHALHARGRVRDEPAQGFPAGAPAVGRWRGAPGLGLPATENARRRHHLRVEGARGLSMLLPGGRLAPMLPSWIRSAMTTSV